MSFCPSSLYSAFHRVCPFLIAIWQSVPQSFSRSLFSSSNKYIRHFIKEQSLFTPVYSLSPSSLTLTSSLSLSPSLFSIPFSRSFSVRVKLQRLLADQLLWPICTSSKDTPPSSIPPLPLVSSPLVCLITLCNLLLKYFYERLNISTGKQDKNTD